MITRFYLEAKYAVVKRMRRRFWQRNAANTSSEGSCNPKEVANSLRAITMIPQTFIIPVVFFEQEQKMKFIFGAVPRLIVIMVAGVLFSSAGAFGQQRATSKNPAPISGSSALSQAQIDSIISAVTIKETQFRQALNEYAFKRDALVQEIG